MNFEVFKEWFEKLLGHAARNNTEPPFSTAKTMTLLQTACAEVTTEDWIKVVEKTVDCWTNK
ncbi:Uncharacterized protein OBRU01_10273, partial [Operophtera brumata]